MSTTIKIRGFVTIKQGEKVVIKKTINHFVDAGLKGLISTIIAKNMSTTQSKTALWYLWQYGWQVYLGQDTTTPTTTGMTSLQDQIGGAPNGRNITVKNGAADGIYHVKYIATWNAGTLPAATLGEAGLYLRAPDKTTFQWILAGTVTYNPSLVMVSRLSEADTDFSSFVIDDTEPLVAEWTVEMSFA